MASLELTKAEFELYGIVDRVEDPNVEVLNRLPEIACYLKCSVSTVRKMIREFGLPAVNMTGGQSGLTWTTKRMLDHWLAHNKLAIVEVRLWNNQTRTLIRRQAA